MSTSVQFRRVLGVNVSRRSMRPQIIAMVDEVHRVTWDSRGWDCTCGDEHCGHIDVVADLVSPRVVGEES